MSDKSDPETKIIVDEDWKSQVQAEKETLAKAKADPPADDPRPEPQAKTPPPSAPRQARGPLPPASLSTLVTTLATQAALLLGELTSPSAETTVESRDDVLREARYLIDLLQMLEEKTQGQRTADETAQLDQSLHGLRMAFVALSPGPAA